MQNKQKHNKEHVGEKQKKNLTARVLLKAANLSLFLGSQVRRCVAHEAPYLSAWSTCTHGNAILLQINKAAEA